jgi:hypothetical protein
MERDMPKSRRRQLVTANYASLCAVVLLVYAGKAYGWSAPLKIGTIVAALALLVATFIGVYWRTRLWHLTHSSISRLDERQVGVVYESLRLSYTVFSLLCLVVLYVNAVAARGPISVLVAGGLLYLAHTLPAAFVAWTETEVLVSE